MITTAALTPSTRPEEEQEHDAEEDRQDECLLAMLLRPRGRPRLRLTGDPFSAVGCLVNPDGIVGTFAMPQSESSYAFAVKLPQSLSFLLLLTTDT